MSIVRARSIWRKRSQSAGVILRFGTPSFRNGHTEDKEGRSIVLVGRHRLEARRDWLEFVVVSR
jgi:hypothetical protein